MEKESTPRKNWHPGMPRINRGTGSNKNKQGSKKWIKQNRYQKNRHRFGGGLGGGWGVGGGLGGFGVWGGLGGFGGVLGGFWGVWGGGGGYSSKCDRI